MKKNVQITERDAEILEHLLKAKIMTGKQILQTHFDNSTFGYRRLSRLRSSGYIDSQAYIETTKRGRRKVGNIYHLARKGIDQMAEKGLVQRGLQPAKLLPRRHEIDFYLALNGIKSDLVSSGKITPDEWKFTSESKKQLGLATYVPLYGVVKDLHIFRAREPFRPRTATTILDASKNFPRSVVLYTKESTRDIIREKHISGQVNLVREEEMARAIPLLALNPQYYLQNLINNIKKLDPRIKPPLTKNHYVEAEVKEGIVLMAETVTGCISTLRRIKNFEGLFYFVLIRDKDSIHDLPLENRTMNVCLPDGTLYQAYTKNGLVMTEEIQ
ncbi:MAG: replication-relaxation family protein [Dethiobacter sp.]|jgi:hypothetical protein|nr:replication-relaxation family protein [Dethiobacter sp.]